MISSNSRANVGSTVTFNCSTDSDSDVRWYFCSVAGCDQLMLIYNGDELDPTLLPRFAVTFSATSPSSSQLKISDIEPQDSGTYSCAEADTFSGQQHFSLDVLGNLLPNN